MYTYSIGHGVCSVVSDSLWPHGLSPTRLLYPWNFPGKNTGVGYHFLLQGIFLTQGLNLHLLSLLHWQVDSLPLNHKEIYYKELILVITDVQAPRWMRWVLKLDTQKSQWYSFNTKALAVSESWFPQLVHEMLAKMLGCIEGSPWAPS